MKNSILLFCLILSVSLNAQSIIGAWEGTFMKDGKEFKSTVIFADGYQAMSTYEAETGAFVSTNGGTWSLDGNRMTERVEWDSADPDRVGTSVSFDIEQTAGTLSIVGDDMVLKRVDSGEPGALQGAWLITGRKRDGELRSNDTTRTRKTMKILSGTRFQWIAFDTGTKEFKGSGGGAYTTVNGKYTEMIGFFSRDDSRVGANLEFDYELVDGHWHHSGLSSKGSPIYEVWSIRK